jgi:hypothetical protein
MAERFVGIVMVRCNCDHAIAGAPVSVRVTGGSGVECDVRGVTNPLGYFLFEYERGIRPIDVQTMEGMVHVCDQELEFSTMDIRQEMDWEAVVDRINTARKLPRGLSIDDLKSQVEFFATFTSADIVMFSCMVEVTARCHPDCDEDTTTDHETIGSSDSLISIPDLRIALDCPTEEPEELEGVIYGWGIAADGGDAQDQAKSQAERLAREKVESLARRYRCSGDCELVTEPTYDTQVYDPYQYPDQSHFEALATVSWRLQLSCRSPN